MDKENFNPASFADFLGINRQTMNATLSRNKTASINIVMAILEKYEDISSDWLLFGKGSMYKGGKAYLQPDLFENLEPEPSPAAKVSEYSHKSVLEEAKNTVKPIEKQIVEVQKIIDKKIDKIIIFYTDKTFVTLKPEVL